MSLEQILSLPAEDKIKIAQQIWDSIREEDITISENQVREIKKRIKLDQEGLVEWRSWDEIKDTLGE